MPLLAHDASDRARQVITISERLTALMREEIAWLGSRRPLLDAPFTDEKARLANLYRTEMACIAEDRALLDTADRTELARLRRATALLQDAVADNAVAIAAMKDLTEGLVQAIAGEVGKARAGPAVYGAQGSTTPAVQAAAARGIAYDTRA
jgi:hypothetical protein